MIRLSAFADEAAGDFEGQLRALERNRIPYIELRGLDGDNILDITEERAREYARRLEKAGKKVWALGSPVGKAKTEDFPRQEKNLLHLCRLARIFGTPRIRVFSFFEAYDKEETVIAHLSRLVELAAREGCTLYHENEKEIFGDTLVRVQRLMDRVPGLEFVYDPANFVQVGEKSENTLPALHSRCRYFHIKDALRETEEIVPIGDPRIGSKDRRRQERDPDSGAASCRV